MRLSFKQNKPNRAQDVALSCLACLDAQGLEFDPWKGGKEDKRQEEREREREKGRDRQEREKEKKGREGRKEEGVEEGGKGREEKGRGEGEGRDKR